MMVMSAIAMEGREVKAQLAGIFAAHLFDFLTRIFPDFGGGPNFLPTPFWVSYIMEAPRSLQRYGIATRQTNSSQGSGTSARFENGPLPNGWRTRGHGHRLGGS